MAYLAGLILFFVLTAAGTIGHRRHHQGVVIEEAVSAVFPGALTLAFALVNDFIALWFVVRLAPDDVLKGILKPYLPPGAGADVLLGLTVTGGLALTLVAVARYRVAVWGQPSRRRR